MSRYTLGNTRMTLEVILGPPDLIQFTILGLHIQILTPNTHGWCYQGPMSLTDVHDLPWDCLWLLHSRASHANSTIRIRLHNVSSRSLLWHCCPSRLERGVSISVLLTPISVFILSLYSKLTTSGFSHQTMHSLDPTVIGSGEAHFWSTFTIHRQLKTKCSFWFCLSSLRICTYYKSEPHSWLPSDHCVI